MKAFRLLLGASVLTFAWSGEAMAQATATAPAPATQQSSQSSQADNAQPAQASDDNQGEIVVTAERRSENLMTTPLSASVLSGADLANRNIVNVDQLQFAIP